MRIWAATLTYHCAALLVAVALVWTFLTIFVEKPRRRRLLARFRKTPGLTRLQRELETRDEEAERNRQNLRGAKMLEQVGRETNRSKSELAELRAQHYANVAQIDSIDQRLSAHVSDSLRKKRSNERESRDAKTRFFTEYEKHLRSLQRTNLLLSSAKSMLDKATQFLLERKNTRSKRSANCDYIDSLKTYLPELPNVRYC